MQHVFSSMLADIEDCVNIADNVLAFGVLDQADEESFSKVLQRLDDYGTTLNLSKYLFH